MQHRIYPQPIVGKGLNRIDVRDIADCAINALMRPGHEGRTYAVHGPDALTGEATAAIYTKHLGRQIRYNGNDLNAWGEQAKNRMPDFLIPEMRIMYQFFQEKGMIATKEELARMQKLLGHTPRTFDDFAREVSMEWMSAAAKAA